MNSKLFFFLFVLFFLNSCKPKLFELLNNAQTNISFENIVTENDSFNILFQANIYNGSGVGVADFNHDGLIDLYFTSNQASNKLYLNQGNFKFIDVTDKAHVAGMGNWYRGVSVIDLNNDQKMDIMVSATLMENADKRHQLLYINQGNDAAGIPIFKEMAQEYHLDDTGFITQTYFFDYDLDGDLDVYKVVNRLRGYYDNTVQYKPKITDGTAANNDQLYQNNWDSKLGHPVFKNVSKEAGILIEGFGHAAAIADYNEDGWPDIYVANDFLTNDILWINNRNGTFTNKLDEYFKHTSYNSMGTTAADINNDGLIDLMTLDMNPADNFRKKTMLDNFNTQSYYNNDKFGYNYQYVRNMLQLNLGKKWKDNNILSPPIFAEIGFAAGIAETDWSWTPVLSDFNNDGLKDLFITNGFPRDITDHDFRAFRDMTANFSTPNILLSKIPAIKIPNYFFINNGNAHFSDNTNQYGFDKASFSNGAISADLDNDGDLDLIVCNLNEPVSIYKNNHRQLSNKNNYIHIKLQFDSLNLHAIGSKIEVFSTSLYQTYLYQPSQGYLCSNADGVLIGLASDKVVDSCIITWPNNKKSIIKNLAINQKLTIPYKPSHNIPTLEFSAQKSTPLFTEITATYLNNLIHHEEDFVDYNVQSLIPHKFSSHNPSLAVGDLNNDHIDDVVIGNSNFVFPEILIQQADGRFVPNTTLANSFSPLKPQDKWWDDAGICIFDANNDGWNDIMISSGGNEFPNSSLNYQDHLFINLKDGNFKLDSVAIPKLLSPKSCIRAFDFDNDGDQDLFIGGRLIAHNYPKPASSFILRNDSKNGNIKFNLVTKDIAPDLYEIGLVNDAIISDLNSDGWADIFLVGEWMSPTILINQKGEKFSKTNQFDNLQKLQGWWTSIISGDFNNDGFTDYIIGNLGKNSFFRANADYPIFVNYNDYDKNGKLDPIISMFFLDNEGHKKRFPIPLWEQFAEQIPSVRKKYNFYTDYAKISADKLFKDDQKSTEKELSANMMESIILINQKNQNFIIKPLPELAQYSVLNGMSAQDYDGDGILDLLINTNEFSMEVNNGRCDALNGLFLKGRGDGTFKTLSLAESGIFIPGNGKALVTIPNTTLNECLILAAQNRGPFKLYKLNRTIRWQAHSLKKNFITIKNMNGLSRKQETYSGQSYLSQSSSKIMLNTNEKIIDN